MSVYAVLVCVVSPSKGWMELPGCWASPVFIPMDSIVVLDFLSALQISWVLFVQEIFRIQEQGNLLSFIPLFDSVDSAWVTMGYVIDKNILTQFLE